MATTLTASVAASIQATYTKTDDMGAPKESRSWGAGSSYTHGKGSNQVEQIYRHEQAVTAAAPWNIDLNGALEDIFGDTIEFERIHAVLVRNLSEVDGDNVNVGPLSQANGWVDPWDGDADGKSRVGPSGSFLIDNPLFNGYEVDNDSQMLRVEHDAVSASVDVQVVIVGSSGEMESSSSSIIGRSSSSTSSSSTSSSSQSSQSTQSQDSSASTSSCTTPSSQG